MDPDLSELSVGQTLLSPLGQTALGKAAQTADPDSLSAVQALRDEFGPELAAEALTQERLRRKAVAKFGPVAARSLYFTATALEQATRSRVTAWRAERLVATGVPGVVDLCCGIGADALAAANAGLDVIAVELDERTAALAAANLDIQQTHERIARQGDTALGHVGASSGRARVCCGDATALWSSLSQEHPDWAVFIDPARRTEAKGRSWRVEDLQPSWEFVLSLLSSGHSCVVKLGPGFPKELIPDAVDAVWVSDGGDLVELSLWTPGSGRRTAVILGDDGREDALSLETDDESRSRVSSDDNVVSPSANELVAGVDSAVNSDDVRYILEPDPAVSRAGLSAQIAPDGAWQLSEHAGYLASETAIVTPFAQCFEVLETLPFNEKALRAWVKAHEVGVLEIKKRGVEANPAVLRRALRPSGANKATLIISPTAQGTKVFVVRRVSAGLA
ncbi:MAG: SAM-dependent methyltransferase [Propionibacteriaceae bacterium]|jgi:SAM-dependent methyltransferase|nr:SAM-dependent methyltransferase [Propionibacteriaceae bacterium]